MGCGVWLTEIGSTLIFVVSEMGYGILLLFYGVLSGFVVTVMGYGFSLVFSRGWTHSFRNSCIVVARVSTTHCRGCIIGYVCIAYMNPLVGVALVVKSFLLCLWKYLLCVQSFALVIYIYFYFVVTLSFICGLIPPRWWVRSWWRRWLFQAPVRCWSFGLVRLCAGVGCAPCFLGLGIGF